MPGTLKVYWKRSRVNWKHLKVYWKHYRVYPVFDCAQAFQGVQEAIEVVLRSLCKLQLLLNYTLHMEKYSPTTCILHP